MSGPNPTLTKSFTAEAAVTKRRIVKYGAADGDVLHADADDAKFAGVAAELDAAIADRVDVHVAGLVEVELGGTVTRGGPITSDANGKAIAAVYDGSGDVNIAGWATVSGVTGDIIPIMLALGTLAPNKVYLAFFINQTDLLAATSHFVACPVAGFVTKCTTAVKKAVTTGGDITVEIGGTAVAGLTVTVADAAAVGDIDTDLPTTPTEATAAIAKDGAIEIVIDSAFATAGELGGFVEVTF